MRLSLGVWWWQVMGVVNTWYITSLISTSAQTLLNNIHTELLLLIYIICPWMFYFDIELPFSDENKYKTRIADRQLRGLRLPIYMYDVLQSDLMPVSTHTYPFPTKPDWWANWGFFYLARLLPFVGASITFGYSGVFRSFFQSGLSVTLLVASQCLLVSGAPSRRKWGQLWHFTRPGNRRLEGD